MLRGVSVVAFIAIAMCGAATHAATLAEKVPDDALLYVEWCGQSNIGSAYDDSHLKTLLETSEIPKLLTTFAPELAERIAKENPTGGEQAREMWSLMQAIWKRPAAIYVAARASGDEPAPMRFRLLCDAGKDVERVREMFDNAAKSCADSQAPLHVLSEGAIVSLANFESDAPGEASLARNDAFKKSVSAVGASPIVLTYLDHDRLRDLAEAGVEAAGNPQVAKSWAFVRDGLSLSDIHQIAVAGRIEKGDWTNTCRVNMTLPPDGVLSAFYAGDGNSNLLNSVPADASTVSLLRVDVGKLFGMTRKRLAELDPAKSAEFEKNLGLLSLVSGTNGQTQFVEQLGTDWVTYTSPAIGGGDLLATVVVNQPKDPKAFNRSMISLASATNSVIATQTKNKSNGLKPRIERATRDDVDVRYWALPVISPAWAMHNERLFISAFPQTTIAAARESAQTQKSIVDTDHFRAFREKLGAGDQLIGFGYVDLQQVVPGQYAALLELTRIPLGFSDLLGVSTPAFVVPPLDALKQTVGPAGYALWIQNDGVMLKTVSPFPGATLLRLPNGVQSLLPYYLRAAMEASKRRPRIRVNSDGDGMQESNLDSEEPPVPPRHPLRPRPGPRPVE